MTKKQIEKEWVWLNFEIFKNRPKTDKPYPSHVVKRRELLLYAQVHLSEISWAKKCKDLETEELHTEAYNFTMARYYEHDKQKNYRTTN
jgi:hypothetical protein